MNLAGSEMEVLNDFKKALEKINFEEYNPRSDDFKNTMFVGLMWLLLKHLSGEEGGHKWADDIMEEMEGARKYLDDYKRTGEEMYRDMAKDELLHAKLLIDHHLETNPGKSVWIEAVLAEHQKMEAVLDMHDPKASVESIPSQHNMAATIGQNSKS